MSLNKGRANLPKPTALLFDWDGTLVDSHPVLAAAMNETLKAFNREPWSYEQWQAWLGLSARDAFPKVFGGAWDDARRIYLEAYGELHLERIQLIKGAAELVEALIEISIPMSVVSNKTGEYLRKEALHFGWSESFSVFIGSGESSRDKPAPDPVYDALTSLVIEPSSRTWFIGDNNVDVACGRAAGCTTILVGEAYPDSNPDCRVEGLPELQNVVFGVLG